MSKLEELINELCPDGVEYKKVGEFCDKITDYTAAGSFADIAKNVKYINGEKGFAQLVRTTDLKSSFMHEDKFVYVDENAFNYLWRVNLDSEALVLPNVGNCGEVYYVTPDIFKNNKNVLGPNAILVKSDKVNMRFLYHIFLNNEFQNNLIKITSSTGQTKFNKTNFKELTVPIPPLPVQREIVRILDNFTELTSELTSELTAELTARKKQYEYYREQLFNLNEETVDYLCLGDETVGKFTRGSGLQKKDFTNTGVGCIHYGQIYTYYGTYTDKTKTFVSEEFAQKARKAKCGDLIIATTSENDEDVCKAVAWLGCEEIVISSDACFYAHNLQPKYVAYFFKTERFQKQKRPLINGTKVRRVNVDNLARIKIPIPTLTEQQRIVDILDRFDTICNDISRGLPAEIKARQQQYEYYRDKLLTFPKAKSEV